MIVYNCLGVYKSGGKSILDKIISQAGNIECIFFIDSRYRGNLNNINYIRIKNNFLNRLILDIKLFFNKDKFTKIIYVNGIPPFIKPGCSSSLYLQNIIFIDKFKSFSFRNDLLFLLKKIYFTFFIKNIDKIFVQTFHMREILYKNMKLEAEILLFYDQIYLNTIHKIYLTGNNLIYPATGFNYKNHENLINAIKYCSDNGLIVNLYLTLDDSNFNNKIFSKIKAYNKKYNLNIINLGEINQNILFSYYKSVDALIYPSFTESLGLPLIEASQFNLSILAGELDYVRDIVDPIETFDPNSSTSIGRAIMRFYNFTYPKNTLSTKFIL